jgi:hypothetical protein
VAAVLSKLLGRTITYRELTFEENKDAMIRAGVPGQIAELNAAGALDWSRAVIARRSTEHGSDLGTYRWVVEQSIALLHWFRRLRIRWEIRNRRVQPPGLLLLRVSGRLTRANTSDRWT